MSRARSRGFTLVELIVVMVVTGILAGSMVIYFRPAATHYLDVGRRANLSNLADDVARLISTEVRTAVPNSLRLTGGDQCVELVPTSDGGRYRMAPDTVSDGAAAPADRSAWIDPTMPVTSFDVLTPFTDEPKPDDLIVIGNQSAFEIYARTNVGTIASVSAAPAAVGIRRITLRTPVSFPPDYQGGRFVIVPKDQQTVTYRCVNIGTNDAGSGTGSLLRYSRYGFNTAGVCAPAQSGVVTATIATHLSSCAFSYDPSQGATQQSGYLQVQIELRDNGAAVNLVFGAHVDNAP